MAFVDEIRIETHAGRGGDGVVRWLHIKGKEKGGPAGGDGGRGGDIIIEGVRDLGALAAYRFAKKFRAQNGESGGSNNKHGRDGEAIVLRVPVGTVATKTSTGESIEVLAEGERTTLYRGGQGGLGNARFKSPTNQNPFDATPGKAGTGGDIDLTLKIIADVGFVGFPNAGKSSLLNALTRAKSKIGAYPFTTLDPHLGDFYGYLLADIPGLIEGASAGRGLGSKFLRHIERTRFIAHLVSAEQEDPVATYRAIRKELDAFGSGLADKRELVVLSKADLLEEEERVTLLKLLSEASGTTAIAVSVSEPDLLKSFSDNLTLELRTP